MKACFQKDTKDTRPLTCTKHNSFIIITKLFNKHKMNKVYANTIQSLDKSYLIDFHTFRFIQTQKANLLFISSLGDKSFNAVRLPTARSAFSVSYDACCKMLHSCIHYRPTNRGSRCTRPVNMGSLCA